VTSAQPWPAGSAVHRQPIVAAVLGGAGLVVLVAGTFLPWLRSGEVVRNSYQTVGIGRRLTLLEDGVLGVLTAAWPAVGIAAALCAALYVIGARRSAAVATLLLTVVAGTVATLAMVVLPGSESTIRVIAVGPIVTLVGAILAVVGALSLLALPRNQGRTRRAGGVQ
jgi:membrane associated rhomboid family serine protease